MISLKEALKKIKKGLIEEILLTEVELDTSSLDSQIDRYLRSYEQSSQRNKDDDLQQNISNRLKKTSNFEPDKGENEEEETQQSERKMLSLREYFGIKEDKANDLINQLISKKPEKSKPEPELATPPAETELEAEPEPEPEVEPTNTDAETPAGDEEGNVDDILGGDEEPEGADDEKPEEVPQRPGELDHAAYANQIKNLIDNAINLLDLKSVIINRATELIRKGYGDEDAKQFEQLLGDDYKIKSADNYDRPY